MMKKIPNSSWILHSFWAYPSTPTFHLDCKGRCFSPRELTDAFIAGKPISVLFYPSLASKDFKSSLKDLIVEDAVSCHVTSYVYN